MANDVIPSFYLSAFTPLGFVSRLGGLCDPARFDRLIMLKGAAPRLRSKLLEYAAAEAEGRGHSVKRVLSALEPGGLEAVFWEGIAIIDSAAPYSLEPLCPSAFEEVFWLGELFDAAALKKSRDEIISLSRRESALLERGRRLLCAADELLGDNRRMALDCADSEKISRQAGRLAEKYLRPGPGGESAFISSGCFSLAEPILFEGETTLLQDENGGCAPLLLKLLYSEAKRRGCPIAAGYSPFSPYGALDLLILPGAGQAFAIESGRFALSARTARVINARRFTDKAKLSRFSARMRFNKKAARQLKESSRQLFEEAAALRRQTADIYQSSLDSRAFEEMKGRLCISLFPPRPY